MAAARTVGARSRRAAAKGKNCSSSCLTKDHKNWGECVRSKGLQISPAINDNYSTKQTTWDRDLDHYAKAVSDGLSPAGTQRHQVDAAIKEADSG